MKINEFMDGNINLEDYDYIFVDKMVSEKKITSKNYFNQVMNFIHKPLNARMFTYNEYGKPYIREGLNFSISHSKDVICLAITEECSIGVDCEKIRPVNYREIASRFFATNEYDYIQRADKSLDAFYTIWCSKEALLKYYEIGMNVPLDSFDTLTMCKKHLSKYQNIFPTQKYIGNCFRNYKLVSYSVKPVRVIEGNFDE